MRRSPGLLLLTLWTLMCGCGGGAIRDPRSAAAAYAKAVASGNADSVYVLLTPAARKTLSRADVKRLVESEKAELQEEARAVSNDQGRVQATARLRFDDGEEVTLDLTNGQFGMTSAGTLPGGARTPEAALDELRRAVARRSYARLLHLLSPATRSAIEQDLRTLVGGLERPETLPIHTSGDAASASTPGGHHVSLKREGGLWRVEDFD